LGRGRERRGFALAFGEVVLKRLAIAVDVYGSGLRGSVTHQALQP